MTTTAPESKLSVASDLRAVLSVKGLEKRFESGRPILRGVSLELTAGERVALMGPSGSGKTTLLHCVAGLEKADAGDLLLAGENLSKLSDEEAAGLRRRSVGIIFQFFHLLPTLSARENIEMPLLLLGKSGNERKDRAKELLERVGLTHRGHALPSQLSGGEMQRVAIARALAGSPPLLLADEPTGNLDSKTGDAILELIAEVAEESRAALLMVTHSNESARICSRQLHLLDGQLTDA